MEYRIIQVKKYIESVDDVREFFQDLIREGIMIHPEDTFDQCEKQEWNLSGAMINRLDSILNDCHDMCERHDVDICEIALEEMSISSVLKVSEDLGWNVTIEHPADEQGKTIFNFAKQSDRGQDFSFDAEMMYGEMPTLIESIYSYYESYDPDEEALKWVGPDGHGKNGAPHNLSDIIKDMEQCEEMVGDLNDALGKTKGSLSER